ncbi:MAG TPA: response regulator [Flavobacterium sp.]|jgi:CheY-like chemotaxis protein
MERNNVFVVDDDKIFHFILQKLLDRKQIKANLHFFENGMDALAGLRNKVNSSEPTPDLILLDINMPVLDGWQFLEEYQQMKGQLDHEPAIYLISSSDSVVDTEKAQAFSHIVKDYLLKPMDFNHIDQIFT